MTHTYFKRFVLANVQRVVLALVTFALVMCHRPAVSPAPAPTPVPSPTATAAPPSASILSPTPALDASTLEAGARAPLLTHRGANLSGGEFGAVPGVLGRDYAFPTHTDVDLLVGLGGTHARVPFRHERLQKAPRTELDAGEWSRLLDVVTYATSRGLSVAIEPHNSGHFFDRILTELEMGDLWGRIAHRLLDTGLGERVWPNLTNEPHDMSTEAWRSLAEAAIREIRRVGYAGWILVPGNGWTGAGHWDASWYGTPNAAIMRSITDPRVAFEVHLYLDTNSDGRGTDCVSETIGVERLKGFQRWLRELDRVGYLGEIGAPNTPTCRAAVTRALQAIEAEPTHWLGWAWWSMGSRWPEAYPLSLQPIVTPKGNIERPQLEWLRPFLCGHGATP